VEMIVLLFSWLLVNGHLCLITPPQRGNLSIAVPGDSACFRRIGPCGINDAATPSIVWTAGTKAEVHFQQNLNHWWAQSPGYLDVSISLQASDLSEESFRNLAIIDDFPARDMVKQTNFTLTVDVPLITTSHAVLRVRYVSNNPEEIYPANNTHATFYQCADIAIRAAPNEVGCCAPTQWKSNIVLEDSVTGSQRISVFYDATSKKIRWDYIDEGLTTITDYVTEKEYVIFGDFNSTSAKCEVYGPDVWVDWCYGKGTNANQFIGTRGEDVLIFENPSDKFHYYATNLTDGTCPPLREEQHVGEKDNRRFTYRDLHVGKLDPAVFQPPSSCAHLLASPGVRGCSKRKTLGVPRTSH